MNNAFFNTPYNYEYNAQMHAEKDNEMPSQTIPDQTKTMQQLLDEAYYRGFVTSGSEVVYGSDEEGYDDDNLDSIPPEYGPGFDFRDAHAELNAILSSASPTAEPMVQPAENGKKEDEGNAGDSEPKASEPPAGSESK